jgi:hypothetical protein
MRLDWRSNFLARTCLIVKAAPSQFVIKQMAATASDRTS